MRLTIEVTEDQPGVTEPLWVSHCIELDIISQATTPEVAIEAVAEAVRMTLQHEAARHGISCVEAFGRISREVRARWLADDLAAMTDSEKHAKRCHPDWEYETTTTGRKSCVSVKPDGDGWEPNLHVTGDGRNWERFDYHEEEYWMRRRKS